MKKILLLLTILISSNVLADWVLLGTSDINDEFYIDPETITKKGNKVRYWRKTNFAEIRANMGSSRVYQEIDCQQKTVSYLSFTSFSQRDFQGKINTFKPEPNTDYIAPDTSDDAFMNYVCK